jgi:hypothetical protein
MADEARKRKAPGCCQSNQTESSFPAPSSIGRHIYKSCKEKSLEAHFAGDQPGKMERSRLINLTALFHPARIRDHPAYLTNSALTAAAGDTFGRILGGRRSAGAENDAFGAQAIQPALDGQLDVIRLADEVR